MQCGNVMLTDLHSQKGSGETEPNVYSIVRYLTYRELDALFTGSAGGKKYIRTETAGAALHSVMESRKASKVLRCFSVS